MKRIFGFIFMASLLIGAPMAFAADAGTKDTDSAPVIQPQSLITRKQKTEGDLRALVTQLGLFYTRTQSALDLLGSKDIDTDKAQEELDAANASLMDAKIALAAFSKVIVPEIKQDKAALELKSNAKKAEDALRSARDHLVNTLNLLKSAVAASTKDGN